MRKHYIRFDAELAVGAMMPGMSPDSGPSFDAKATDVEAFGGWFAGPKAENGKKFSQTIQHILEDYHHWRRNYFPEDGALIDSSLKRAQEEFQDQFDDRLLELLAKLKADFPFYSPRYAAHMIAEQTLPSIAGYFAAMLYNPNNVTADSGSVTLRLELEASSMIARMLGYGDDSWAHITSGGTLANFEALWLARTVKYLPLVVAEMASRLGLGLGIPSDESTLLGMEPDLALYLFEQCFEQADSKGHPFSRVISCYRSAAYNVGEQGIGHITSMLGSSPVLLIPETHHYCLLKACDLLGMGKKAVVRVRVDADFRMDVNDLRQKLEAIDQDPKRHVFAVVCVVGTTEEGAVDPVNEVLDLRAERVAAGLPSFWVHADGAYGGYLRTMTVPNRLGLGDPATSTMVYGEPVELQLQLPQHSACDALERLGEVDSVAIDPHKLGYIPYPAGVVCFKSSLVKPLARQDAPYLEENASGPAAEKAAENVGVYILEGSKPGAAAAAVWLSHKLIPLDSTGHGKLIRETVRNACELHALLESFPGLAYGLDVRAISLCPPGSNILCFAFRPETPGANLREINALNRAIYERFTVSERSGKSVYEQGFFLSRTQATSSQYCSETVQGFLDRLGVTAVEYDAEGVFLLRSVLMNPWYGLAKEKGRYFLAELVQSLHEEASQALGSMSSTS